MPVTRIWDADNSEWQLVGGTSAIDAEGVPVGAVVAYGGSTVPDGWLICDGQAVSRTEYDELFAAIGTTHGAGDGSTTFNLPDLKGRMAAGFDSGDSAFDTLGEKGGSKTSTAPHSHLVDPPNTNTGNQNQKHVHGAKVKTNSTDHIHDDEAQQYASRPSGAVSFASDQTQLDDRDHIHSVNIPEFNSGGSSAEATDGNLPPYTTIYWLIKAFEGSAGQLHDHDSYSQGTLGYAEVTANQTGIVGEVGLTDLSVTVDIPAGRRIKITGYVPIASSVSGDRAYSRIRVDGTGVTYAASGNSTGPGNEETELQPAVILTPAAGQYTYDLSLARYAGTGTITMGAANGHPAFILVEDIGAA